MTLAIPPLTAITITIPTHIPAHISTHIRIQHHRSPNHIRFLLAKAATAAALESREDILLALAQLALSTKPTNPTTTAPHPLRRPQARKPARRIPIRRAATTTTTPASLRQLKTLRIVGRRIVAAARARQPLPPAEQWVEVRDGGAEDDDEVLDCGPRLENDEVPCFGGVSWGVWVEGEKGRRAAQVMSLRAPSSLIR